MCPFFLPCVFLRVVLRFFLGLVKTRLCMARQHVWICLLLNVKHPLPGYWAALLTFFSDPPPPSLLLQSRREMYSTSWYSLPIPTCKFISCFQNTSSALGVCLFFLPFCEPFHATLNTTYVEVFGTDPGLNERFLCGQYDLTSSSLFLCYLLPCPVSVQCMNEDKS